MDNIVDYLKEQRNQEWRDEIRKNIKLKANNTKLIFLTFSFTTETNDFW